MTEVNVAGKLNAKIFVENNEIRHEKKHIRMKEWMWSVNARAGASYPLLRFLSVYAEVGAGYYFDNGSDIERSFENRYVNCRRFPFRLLSKDK